MELKLVIEAMTASKGPKVRRRRRKRGVGRGRE